MILTPLLGVDKGTVYIIVGTDCSFNPYGGLNYYGGRLWQAQLYSEPDHSITSIMDTTYRGRYKDSFGTPIKLTWYIMGGNIFDLSVNCNVPIRSNNALYLMQKYHQDKVALFDDQLSFHYHNYRWFDSDGDGTPYWNMGTDFNLSVDDYELTLCKYLIENDVFPISFRSGWHFMDNVWQAYEEKFVPFDFSNAYPNKMGDTREPSWFVDWSESPSEFVPYHPNEYNYQIKGDLKQWRLRSVQFQDQSLTLNYLTSMFQEAANGKDQMICTWGHPAEESSFLNGLNALNANLHDLSTQYGVEFKYCKDIEAMRLWLSSQDTLSPTIMVDEIPEGENIRFKIEADGPIFQSREPFVAVKTVYETYERLSCTITDENQWETIKSIPRSILAKLAVAVCDSVGNQTKVHLNYAPDDIYIDDLDDEFQELSGTWTDNIYGELWNMNSHLLNGEGSVKITPQIEESRKYKILFHAPYSTSNHIRFIIEHGGIGDTIIYNWTIPGLNHWNEVGVFDLEQGTGNTLTIENLASDKQLGLDVVRFSPLVANKNLRIEQDSIILNELTIIDSTIKYISVKNLGFDYVNLTLSLKGDKALILSELTISLDPNAQLDIPIAFISQELGEYRDTLLIESDDPNHLYTQIPIYCNFVDYFKLVDNDDYSGYEEFGDDWHTSSAIAYGPSTRYAWYHANGQHADFTTTLAYSDTFDVQYIIPETANAVDHAHHILIVDGTPIDTVVVDQNYKSGEWRSMGEYVLPADVPIIFRIQDNGGNTNTNPSIVLRADAVRFLLKTNQGESSIEPEIPTTFKVYQNYPNPFNPSTEIAFELPQDGLVTIDFFDLCGRIIDTQIKRDLKAGLHKINWHPIALTSGIYLFRVKTEQGMEIKKCTYLK